MSVHKHVNEGVGNHKDTVITSGVGHEEKTHDSGDTAVMVHMQESDLAEGLTEYKQEGVNVLPVLLDIVDIHELGVNSNQQYST